MEKNDPLRFRREVRKARKSPGLRISACLSIGKHCGLEQRSERRDTNSGAHKSKELPSSQCEFELPFKIHNSRDSCSLEIYSFVIVSSRFSIALATIVQAASSDGLRLASHVDSPTAKSSDAAFLSLRYRLSCCRNKLCNICRSFGFGGLAVARRKAKSIRLWTSFPPSLIVRCARRRAASM